MKIYMTGCTHFGHSNIIKLCNRPFASVEEMDEMLIENHNKVVGKDDIVYHHGDFSFRGRQDNVEIIKRLNGKVITIQGNHDPILWGQYILEYKANKKSVVMCHYPFEEWNGYFRGAIHTHCHTHKSDLVSAPRRFNVGVDSCNYTPISLDEIMEHPNAKL